MKYNGGLTREQFMFNEMRITARLLAEGLSDQEVLERVYIETANVWNAYYYYPYKNAFWDDETMILFCQDVYMEVRSMKCYKTDEYGYAKYNNDVKSKYVTLLQKYKCSEERIDIAVREMMFRYYYGWVDIECQIADDQDYQDELPELEDDDKDVTTIASVLSTVPDKPIVREFLERYGIVIEEEHAKASDWFASQIVMKEGIRFEPDYSGISAYERVSDLKMLISLVAMIGENLSLVKKAADEAFTKKGIICRCDTIREYISFERVCVLLDERLAEFKKEHPESEEDIEGE